MKKKNYGITLNLYFNPVLTKFNFTPNFYTQTYAADRFLAALWSSFL